MHQIKDHPGKYLLTMCAVALFTAVVLVIGQSGSRPPHPGTLPVSRFPKAKAVTPRPIYKHSVVSGGVYSAVEAERITAEDVVVRRHYQGVRVDGLKPARTPKAQALFVSYRRGDQVFWTRRRVPIPAGEILLTDGSSAIRTRCGNRVADAPMKPVSPKGQEPDPAELEQTETGESTERPAADLKVGELVMGSHPSAFGLPDLSDLLALPLRAGSGNEGGALSGGLSSGPGTIGLFRSRKSAEGNIVTDLRPAELTYLPDIELWAGLPQSRQTVVAPVLMLIPRPGPSGAAVGSGLPRVVTQGNPDGPAAISEALTTTTPGNPSPGLDQTLNLIQLADEGGDASGGGAGFPGSDSSAIPEPATFRLTAVSLAIAAGAFVRRHLRRFKI